MRMRRVVSLGVSLAVLLAGVGCEKAPVVDHLAVARSMAEELKTQGKEDISDPAYDRVADELQLVPSSAPEYAEAQAWQKQIRDARKSKLWTLNEQEGGSFADKQKVKKAAVASRTANPSNPGAPPGWDPYHANPVDMNAIQASVSGGGTGSSVPVAAHTSSSSGKKAKKSKGITIYTASWCGVCKAAKAYMRSKGIAYVEKDVEKDPAAKAEMDSRVGGTASVPVIDVNGEVMVGFEESALDRMIKRNGI